MVKIAISEKRTAKTSAFRHFALILLIALTAACSQITSPASNTFFAVTPPPPKQEFRWSNGRMPLHLDPARAAAAPETDIVRAMYEGLTELDPQTLQAVPGVAEKWESSDDLRTWTFIIRENAVWSDGRRVTAQDFVNAWSRWATLGERAANTQLTANIVGAKQPASKGTGSTAAPPETDFAAEAYQQDAADPVAVQPQATVTGQDPNTNTAAATDRKPSERKGFRAEDDRTLVVELIKPDKDLPRLVANPIFLPVRSTEKELASTKFGPGIVSNGAFKLTAADETSLTLERSETYWNREAVALDRVIFKPAARAEDALIAYRNGELDAITNANFEPLALKLLEPYEDFRKGTFAALNFYKVNTKNAPFDDRRVRRALAIAIDRERLTEGDLAGTTRPAMSFLPFSTGSQTKLAQDRQQALDLLDDAGFPEGEEFPTIRLVVNRNDTQQRVARSVARMWKQNLNLETEIIVKDQQELEEANVSGDYDLIRRGVVLPTADEATGMTALFGDRQTEPKPGVIPPDAVNTGIANTNTATETPESTGVPETLTEEIAIFELEGIPLYFPTSYSLVKPYIIGFDMNVLDAPLLRNVRIDNSWQPKQPRAES